MEDPLRGATALSKSNALSFVDQGKRLPDNVFVGNWNDYLFFDPYTLFSARFIDIKNFLMYHEAASAIAIVNLGNVDTIPHEQLRVLYVERDTSVAEYISNLKGDGTPDNWMFLVDRYVFSSDGGNWAIYCEKENDIAIFAYRGMFIEALCPDLSMLLEADSIKSARFSPVHKFFDFRKLVPEWRARLFAQYSTAL